jgi:hypothetical protein
MKHEKFKSLTDQAPAAFVRVLAICLVLGAAFWAALLTWLV